MSCKHPYVECTTCHKTKAPIGRSVPTAAANSYCDSDCEGYRQDPKPSGHWPGEDCDYTTQCLICWSRPSKERQAEIQRLKEQRAVLIEALEPLAGQDCESWGCDIDEGICEPTIARAALAAIDADKDEP